MSSAWIWSWVLLALRIFQPTRNRWRRDSIAPWFLLYLRQQRDGPFWRRASVAPDRYAEYNVPSFLVGGFLDGYRDSIPRFFENSKRR